MYSLYSNKSVFKHKKSMLKSINSFKNIRKAKKIKIKK